MPTERPDRQRYPHATLTRNIIGGYYQVYNAMGYGYSESVYVNSLAIALSRRGLSIRREWPIDVTFEGELVGEFRADLLCEDRVLIEVKAGAQLPATAFGQLLNYLRGTNLPVGLLLHFGPKPSIKRVVNHASPLILDDPDLSSSRGEAAPG